jgi:hypothetical protein
MLPVIGFFNADLAVHLRPTTSFAIFAKTT